MICLNNILLDTWNPTYIYPITSKLCFVKGLANYIENMTLTITILIEQITWLYYSQLSFCFTLSLPFFAVSINLFLQTVRPQASRHLLHEFFVHSIFFFFHFFSFFNILCLGIFFIFLIPLSMYFIKNQISRRHIWL